MACAAALLDIDAAVRSNSLLEIAPIALVQWAFLGSIILRLMILPTSPTQRAQIWALATRSLESARAEVGFLAKLASISLATLLPTQPRDAAVMDAV